MTENPDATDGYEDEQASGEKQSIHSRISEITSVGKKFDDDGAAFDECHRSMYDHLISGGLEVDRGRSQQTHAAIELSHRYFDEWEKGDKPKDVAIEFVETVTKVMPEDGNYAYKKHHEEYQRQIAAEGIEIDQDRHPMISDEQQ